MYKNFDSYTSEIKASIQQIPDNNVLFWGGWFCQFLFDKYEHSIPDFFSKDVSEKISNAIDFVWEVVDNRTVNKKSIAQKLLEQLNDIDDTELDQLDEEQDAVYELIISLDAILNGLPNNYYAWAYNVSQSTINVIDKILQKEDIDLTTDKGFNNALCLEEVQTLFKMIDWLKHHTGTSQDKRLFR